MAAGLKNQEEEKDREAARRTARLQTRRTAADYAVQDESG